PTCFAARPTTRSGPVLPETRPDLIRGQYHPTLRRDFESTSMKLSFTDAGRAHFLIIQKMTTGVRWYAGPQRLRSHDRRVSFRQERAQPRALFKTPKLKACRRRTASELKDSD